MIVESKWPKIIPPLSDECQAINDDFMKYWHQRLATGKFYHLIEKFNHGYSVDNILTPFVKTLEIGAGLGEHLKYEKLSQQQRQNYAALELRENMATEIKRKYPDITVLVADCQTQIEYPDNYYDRILAIHVLEHLPNLPAAIKEMHRLCNKKTGFLSVVIPCEGAILYSFSRKISAQRIFEKRYKRAYDMFIKREHINLPQEIFAELEKFFTVKHKSFFPFNVPIINMNLCIGITLRPK